MRPGFLLGQAFRLASGHEAVNQGGPGIKKIAIQPKGKAQPLVSQRDHRKLANRRVAVEARIAHLKLKGLGRSRMKTDLGDLISGYRSALACNLGHLMRDLALQPVAVDQ
jgi:hypothetical protein